jgi:hypothetical protein
VTTQVRSTRTTSNGNYNGNQLNPQMAGVHLSPNGNDHFRRPHSWSNYQPSSVSPYPDDDDYPASRQGGFESRAYTNTSQQSFGMQNSVEQTQGQVPQRPPKRSFSPEPGRNPTSQPDRSVSNTNIPMQSWSQFSQSGQHSPDHHRSQSSSFSSNRSMSSQSSPGHPSNRTDSPHLRPSRSSYSLNGAQLADTNRMTNPMPSRKPVPPQGPVAWTCDVCLRGVSAKEPRFRCTVCYDYDLCLNCHQKEATSEGHLTSHKIRSISMRHDFPFTDLVPSHNNVTPEFSPPRVLPNWTVDETERRWLHLRNSPSHARLIIQGVSRGAYLMYFKVKAKLSQHVNINTFNQLKGLGLGKLKIAAGSPLRTPVFLNEPKTEDGTLAEQLFGIACGDTFTLKIPDHVKDPKESWEWNCELSTPVYIGMDARVHTTSSIAGILLQWSEVQAFKASEEPILLISLNEVL